MRKIVSDLIEADSEFKVTATASNGKEAIQKAIDLKPDIITMDVEMPEMNGLDALKSIMKQSFVPVIMLSGINEQGMKETIMALEAGAFDFIPDREASMKKNRDEAQSKLLHQSQRVQVDPPLQDRKGLLKKTIEPAQSRLAEHETAAASAEPSKDSAKVIPSHKGAGGSDGSFNKLVAIGCSTGGPRALKTLLEQLPGDLPAPVIIVQHMPPNFTRSLAQRLNTFSELHVVEAEEGMVLRKGTAYIAPGGFHVKINKTADGRFTIKLTEEEPVNGHRPSVDTMFESLLPYTSLQRHLVLLTGMGSDGARMMKKLYEAGVTSTFAENEETCVVYGMPRSAVELQCVRHLLPLQEIAPKLVQAVK
ncbi:hypothetical protein G195_000640 [Phytophthora kernoviae 00238/432]|uniref:protein-glutamate methylesterase n=1 Tax=Phytophthora kernoviae 00238/432 TaxID=1284355 RepID=A0A8J4SHX1_9STRA|nr:hypothetical protein G195_000640 [Phytophthora kernoviae 00238/432]